MVPIKFNLPPKVFISYSHEDKDFAEKLIHDLTKNRVIVWWDLWEIKVGDSILNRIEEGILSSSNLAVILSPASVSSNWVKEELRAGLNLQIAQKIKVLPLLIRDCEIPLFLRDKRYADFRTDYDIGFRDFVKSLVPPDTGGNGREENAQYFNDYDFDWFTTNGRFGLKITISHHSPKLPYSINCTIKSITTEALSNRLHEYQDANLSWAIPKMLLFAIEEFIKNTHPIIYITGDDIAETNCKVIGAHGLGAEINVQARRIGPDPGTNILFEWGNTFMYLLQRQDKEIKNAITREDANRFLQFITQNPL